MLIFVYLLFIVFFIHYIYSYIYFIHLYTYTPIQALLAKDLPFDTPTKIATATHIIKRALFLGLAVSGTLAIFTSYNLYNVLSALTKSVEVQLLASQIMPIVLLTQLVKGILLSLYMFSVTTIYLLSLFYIACTYTIYYTYITYVYTLYLLALHIFSTHVYICHNYDSHTYTRTYRFIVRNWRDPPRGQGLGMVHC